jgi:glycosyltransferase-like protein
VTDPGTLVDPLAGSADPRVALVTYTTRPRGGPVHALRLGEELHRLGYPVHLFALGDPDTGFFRDPEVPYTLISSPTRAETLQDRVFEAADALASGMTEVAPGFAIVHVEDCIAATAALRIRDAGARWRVLRTVHHVDDFTTPALVECQQRSIEEPDACLVVSDHWRERLRDEYGIHAMVVRNGVDVERFGSVPSHLARAFRARMGARDRFVFLTVGGIEPRKGSLELFEALAGVRDLEPRPLLAIVGGHSFQDHDAYRRAAFERAEELGLREDEDYVRLGTLPDTDLPIAYAAADAFAFPSNKEGFGIVLLEALAAGLPVLTTDLPVFREYLVPGRDALMVPAGSSAALGAAMARLVREPALRSGLAAAGPPVARRFPWADTARAHVNFYRALAAGSISRPSETATA